MEHLRLELRWRKILDESCLEDRIFQMNCSEEQIRENESAFPEPNEGSCGYPDIHTQACDWASDYQTLNTDPSPALHNHEEPKSFVWAEQNKLKIPHLLFVGWFNVNVIFFLWQFLF